MADTRGLQQDELHKESIAAQIKEHVDSISAVLVLADGTAPRVTVGTDYALSTLSAIFSQTLVNNIAFMFTNVSSRLHWNFSKETVPDVLSGAPHFLLNNPIALQRKYRNLMNDSSMRKRRTEFRRAVKSAEEETLGVLVDLFDWLDRLEPQPTADVVSRYHNTLVSTNQAVAKPAVGSASYSPCSHTALESYPQRSELTVEEGYTGAEKDSRAYREQPLEQARGILGILKNAQVKVQAGLRKVILRFTSWRRQVKLRASCPRVSYGLSD